MTSSLIKRLQSVAKHVCNAIIDLVISLIYYFYHSMAYLFKHLLSSPFILKVNFIHGVEMRVMADWALVPVVDQVRLVD